MEAVRREELYIIALRCVVYCVGRKRPLSQWGVVFRLFMGGDRGAGKFVDGLQHGVDADVNILFRGGEFGVAHDLLDDAGRDVLQRQGGGSSVPAGIGCQTAAACTGEGFVVDLVEVILIDLYELVAGRVGAEVSQDREDDVCQHNGRFPALPSLFSCADNLLAFPVDALFAAVQEFAGHHAGVDHQQDVTGPPVAVGIVGPEFGDLLRFEGLLGLGIQVRQLDELCQVGFYILIRQRDLVQLREEVFQIPGGIEGAGVGVHGGLQVEGCQQVDLDEPEGLQLVPGDSVFLLPGSGKLLVFPGIPIPLPQVLQGRCHAVALFFQLRDILHGFLLGLEASFGGADAFAFAVILDDVAQDGSTFPGLSSLIDGAGAVGSASGRAFPLLDGLLLSAFVAVQRPFGQLGGTFYAEGHNLPCLSGAALL